MYCGRSVRSRSVACGKIKTPGADREENRRRLKGLRCMAGRRADRFESCGKLQARCGKPKAIGGVLLLRRASFSTEKRVDVSAYAAGRDELPRVCVKLGRPFKPFRRIRRRCAGQAPCYSARNPAPREVLNLGLRFAQGSNINSTDESCGKLKAMRFGRFSLRQDKVFPRRRCGRREIAGRHKFAEKIPQICHAAVRFAAPRDGRSTALVFPRPRIQSALYPRSLSHALSCRRQEFAVRLGVALLP
jgi:hypothetical protein